MAEEQTINKDNLSRDATIINPVDLIFPLTTEVTIELNKLPSYIDKLTKLFDYYEKQLAITNKQIKSYNLKNEISGLNSFLISLQSALEATKNIKPIIATDQEKTLISDYEILTIKIIDGLLETDSNLRPINWDNRNFTDGSNRPVFIYDRIDTLYLTNKTFARTMAVFTPLEITNFGINPSTLSLIFNIKQIVDHQINSPISTDVLLCAGRQTTLSKLEQGFTILGFDFPLLTSKVPVSDFLNAYIHPQQQIGQTPRLTIAKPKGCNQQVKDRISLLRSNITLYNLQNAIAGEDPFDQAGREKLSKDKKELIELTKLCPELASEIAPFEKIKELQSLGKLYTDFIERYNLACIVDEAIKCVMPQIPCEQILRDISVDNFETRLKAAFPFAQQTIGAISNNIKTTLEQEKQRRLDAGNPELTIDEQSQIILDTINTFIDIEALCKIDINAIAELIAGLLNFKLPQFNMFDWQFNLKIDFEAALIEGLLRSILNLISQILNQLIGCNSLDALVAGIIGNNIQADSGLYGDLAAIFGGDFNLNSSNTAGILGNSLNNFLTQSSQQLSQIIKFETKLGNNFLGTVNLSGNLGLGTSLDGIIAGQTAARYDRFGGLISVTRTDTGSVGLAGFNSQTQTIAELDVTKLASTEGQMELLKEIGKFQTISTEQGTQTVRISDDSIIKLINIPVATIQAGQPSTITQASTEQTTQQNIFALYGLRDTNNNIINALTVLNTQENRSTLYITQDSLGEQLKEYIKTCFALLSPTEVIDLITGTASQEIKLTITGISQARFPLLNSILKYPDRHAILFASFGAITGLDSISTRLQILASSPNIKQKMVDPNVCAPFSNIYDFREGLMNQVLPPELANNLINNIIEDNRQKANKLIESLAKGPQAPQLATNPNLFINKTADGKPIQEIDEVVDSVLDSILDQVKITFDEDLDSFPAATEATFVTSSAVFKNIKQQQSQVFGFIPSENLQTITNQEFTDLENIFGSTLRPQIEERTNNPFYNKTEHKKQVGKLFKDIFKKYKADIQTGFLDKTALRTDTNTIDVLYRVSAESSLEQSDELSRFRLEDAISSPSWQLDYKETDNGKYRFVIKSSGDILTNAPPTINFNESIIFSGSTIEIDSYLQQLITEIGLSTKVAEPCNNIVPPTRFEVFKHILEPQLRKIFNFQQFSTNNAIKKINKESKFILDSLAEEFFRNEDFINSKLLQIVKSSSDFTSESPDTVLLNLVDFTPIQTEEHKKCGVDTHLLQLESVKRRIKQQFDTTPPENIINTNSRINTRYTDGKPGPLSIQLMTGLADTFIRTSVIHNIFKGLFIFDKFNYNLSDFSYQNLVYLFFENRVKKDIKAFELIQDFENEYDKIYEWYINEQLIFEQESGSKFYKIIKYHVDSVLQFLNKLLNGTESEEERCDIVGFKEKQTNLKFLNKLPIKDTYSNFYNFENYSFNTNGEFTDEGAINREIDTTTFYLATQRNLQFTSNTDITDIPRNHIILERYIHLNFKDQPPGSLGFQLKSIFTLLKDEIFLNNVVNINNFREIYNYLATIGHALRQQIVLYTDDPQKKHLNWLKEKPKIGLRVVLKKTNSTPSFLVENYGFSKEYRFEEDQESISMNESVQTSLVLEDNKAKKNGTVQSIQLLNFNVSRFTNDNSTRNELRNAKRVNTRNIKNVSLIPLIEKEIVLDEPETNAILTELIPNSYAYFDISINNLIQALKQKIVDDPNFTLLVNYCLQSNVANTLALFNSLIGMNTEPMHKLFDKTKQVIKNNFVIHRDSSKFKNKPPRQHYQKFKALKTDGPPTIDYLKAAATIPIGLLKGLSVAVDPNIFLADKIVLAGKMGFIQPRYKRFEQGENILEQNTNAVIETSQGIAAGGSYVLENGEYKAKQNPQEGGTPLLDYPAVAQTETRNGKIFLLKNSENKTIVKYGPPFTGIPWNPKSDTALDENFDENNISSFDIRPSLPIYPGESINIPYKVASLALAPFPIFGANSLTTYNIAMPFGPLFLALEDILAQNPQYKLSIPKQKADSPIPNTADNLLCDTEE